MTTGGWTIMIVSVTFVTGLLAWCIYRVLSTPEAVEHIHSRADIKPTDLD